MSDKRGLWVWRIVLGCVIAAGVVVGVVYELNARAVLTRGAELEREEKYPPAGLAYRLVVERYPFSYASSQAKAGLLRIEPALDEEVDNQRLGLTALEGWFGDRLNPYCTDYLPLVSWSVCAVMLLVVFLRRLGRPVVAVVSLLLAVTSGAGALMQLFWYELAGDADTEGLANLIARPELSYTVSYVLMGVTVLLMLTSSDRRTTEEDTPHAERPALAKASPVREIPIARAVAGEASTTSAEEKLRALKEMLAEGLISGADYEAKKKEILREM